MLKKLLAALLALMAAAAFAAADVNKADQAALESIKGIGPAISGKILDERKKGAFKDWNDLIERVKGVGEGNAAKFSADGMTVNGASFSGAPAAKKDDAGTGRHATKTKKEEPSAMAASAPAAATTKRTAAEKRAEKKAAREAAADKKASAAADRPSSTHAAADRKAGKEAATGKPAAAASATAAKQ